jgi:hypothetical protein
MPSINSLLPKLTTDFPAIQFAAGDEFRFSPREKTVYYPTDNAPLLLHELSHALLGHESYSRDIDLLRMERDAWEKARQLAPTYGVTIAEETVQDHLDSYRDWLHDRSTCPSCLATGRQTGTQSYHCDACGQDWRVNEARLCGLKRYKL